MARKQSEDPTEWVNNIFEAKAASNGGILKRNIKSVEKRSSRNHLITKVKDLGFHLYETDTYFIIICSFHYKLEEIC